MRIQLLAIPIIWLAGATASLAEEPKTPPSNAAAAFERLKSLVGEWEADTSMGKSHIKYELIASGSALVERESISSMHEMMTVYHLDGNRLILTHYCAAGNQPRMQAQTFDPASGKIDFRFLDATNLASPAAAHMHNATMRFVDDKRFESEWQFYVDGKPKATETFQYTRVK